MDQCSAIFDHPQALQKHAVYSPYTSLVPNIHISIYAFSKPNKRMSDKDSQQASKDPVPRKQDQILSIETGHLLTVEDNSPHAHNQPNASSLNAIGVYLPAMMNRDEKTGVEYERQSG